ncbi:MAG: sigma-54-dependent Fis family transcriptional regulator [Planctomycetota bacterium]|nr:MAG: sigma-54-dependent Fis family transcriptional regulator [Planctomycetota bacterium]
MELLILEDETPLREFLQKKLENAGHQVSALALGKEALELVEKKDFDVAILDISLPDMSGIDVLKKITSLQNSTECIMLTGYASVESAIEAMKLGAYDYLEKPAKLKEIQLVIEKAYEKVLMNRELATVRQERKRSHESVKMVGKSPKIMRLRKLMQKIALAPSPVLIEGESGTGKEVIAREIHRLAFPQGAPFISVDCATLQETLFENELFGHAKGAYTGADSRHIGLVELANGGTLFVDEVGELELGLQKKFLRFLETGEYRPLGDSKTRKVEVRVIAATNRVLKKAVEEGKFREDLYYRLNVVRIEVPPLRERKEDIPLLVEHFLKLYPSPTGKAKSFDPKVLQLFQSYPWPGNIRELRNVVERALILSNEERITLDDIPPFEKEDREEISPTLSPPTPSGFPTLAAMEKNHIQKALEIHSGNKTEAAKALGISLRSLYRKLEKYGLG